jgi:hypothetical protein
MLDKKNFMYYNTSNIRKYINDQATKKLFKQQGHAIRNSQIKNIVL